MRKPIIHNVSDISKQQLEPSNSILATNGQLLHTGQQWRRVSHSRQPITGLGAGMRVKWVLLHTTCQKNKYQDTSHTESCPCLNPARIRIFLFLGSLAAGDPISIYVMNKNTSEIVFFFFLFVSCCPNTLNVFDFVYWLYICYMKICLSPTPGRWTGTGLLEHWYWTAIK